MDSNLGSTGEAPRPPHPHPIRFYTLICTQRANLPFFFSHSLIRADSAPKPAEIGRNPPKLAEKLAETHVKKNKNKLELISYLVFNLLYNCQIICRLNNSN